MKIIATLLLALAASSAFASDTLDHALRASAAGDYDKALLLWEQLASEGDKNAMTEVALIHHQGLGRPVSYETALNWYLKAMNGDTLNNVGVMFRDGTGLPQNRKIAYLMFLTVHMTGAGSEATVMRANRNLRREVAELPESDIKEALCYTSEYLLAYIQSRGTITGIPQELRASAERKRIKELDWWMPGEIGAYDCPGGT